MTPFLSGTTCIAAPADRSCSWQVATPLQASQSSLCMATDVECMAHDAPFLAVALFDLSQLWPEPASPFIEASPPDIPAVVNVPFAASWPQPEIEAVIAEAFAPWLHPENDV